MKARDKRRRRTGSKGLKDQRLAERRAEDRKDGDEFVLSGSAIRFGVLLCKRCKVVVPKDEVDDNRHTVCGHWLGVGKPPPEAQN